MVRQDLITEGLGVAVFEETDTDKIAGDLDQVGAVNSSLNDVITKFTSLMSNINATGDEILNDWTGTDATSFRNNFPKLVDCLSKVPGYVEQMSAWSTKTANNMYQAAEDSAEQMAAHFRG